MSLVPPPVSSLLDLSGRTVVVTGASGGIGSGIARRLAEAGANVVVHHHSGVAAASALVKEIEARGGKAAAVRADLTVAGECAMLVAAAVERFGGVDAIVNNAGIQPVAALADISRDDFRTMLDANVGGPFSLVQAFAAQRRASGEKGGAVVNIASIEGLQPAPRHSHYATSKAALVMFTRAAAIELGDLGIRVNCISPGLIHRDGIEEGWPEGVAHWKASAPLARLGRPEDIGDAALFLVSDAARWITGANLVVDGGVSARPTW